MALVAVGMLGVAAYQAVAKRRDVKRQLHEHEALMAVGAVPVPFLEQVCLFSYLLASVHSLSICSPPQSPRVIQTQRAPLPAHLSRGISPRPRRGSALARRSQQPHHALPSSAAHRLLRLRRMSVLYTKSRRFKLRSLVAPPVGLEGHSGEIANERKRRARSLRSTPRTRPRHPRTRRLCRQRRQSDVKFRGEGRVRRRRSLPRLSCA